MVNGLHSKRFTIYASHPHNLGFSILLKDTSMVSGGAGLGPASLWMLKGTSTTHEHIA